MGGGRGGRRAEESDLDIEERLKFVGLMEESMLRGCGGGTGGSLGGAGGGGGAVPPALQLLWSSLAPHPVEEMPLLLKEGENAPLLSGKVPPKGESPPLIPLERGAPSIQVFLVSPRVVTKDNLCVQVSVHVYCVVTVIWK